MTMIDLSKIFTKYDFDITKKVIKNSILMKQDQIKNEPNEPIWKEELFQLYGSLELISQDEESVLQI